MRDELHESGQMIHRDTTPAICGGRRRQSPGGAGCDKASAASLLAPQAVDAALADESMTMLAERGSRRDMSAPTAGLAAAGAKRAIDEPHVLPSDGEGVLLRSLSEQMALLQLQQEQIRRLLEQAERQFSIRTTQRA